MLLRVSAGDFFQIFEFERDSHTLSNMLSPVISYTAVHLEHGKNYKLLQILTILHMSCRFDVSRSRIRNSQATKNQNAAAEKIHVSSFEYCNEKVFQCSLRRMELHFIVIKLTFCAADFSLS